MASKETFPWSSSRVNSPSASSDHRSAAGATTTNYQHLSEDRDLAGGSGGGGGDKISMPPPVAMSLRARQSSAMALKRIFDQMNARSALAREEFPPPSQMNSASASASALSREEFHPPHLSSSSPSPSPMPYCLQPPSNRQQSAGGFQITRNQSLSDLRTKFFSETEFSFSKTDQEQASQSAFGSPAATPKAMTRSLSELSGSMGWSNTNFNMKYPHQSILPQATSISRPNPPSRSQPAAQLTIFYSGSVNIYDNVPADKAHAIMLLAGNSLSSHSTHISSDSPMEKEKYTSPNPHNISIANSAVQSAERGSATPIKTITPPTSAPLIMSPTPSPAAPTESRQPVGVTSTTRRAAQTGIELPHARKASLARFLEKRKDRAQVQQQQLEENPKALGESTMNCGEGDQDPPSCTRPVSPSRSSKKQCIGVLATNSANLPSSSHFTNNPVEHAGFSQK